MSRVQGAVAFLIVTLVLAGSMSSIPAVVDRTISLTPVSSVPAATDLKVNVREFNYQQEFNDDDFEFRVLNYSYEVAGANVTLWNATDDTMYDSKLTDGTGYAIFYNLPNGTYKWNVTWSSAPGVVKEGQIISDGPEATVDWEIGNLDLENDDDDLLATVLDVAGDPGEGLNFSIHHRDNNSIYTQIVLGSDGVANITDIPIGNFTWKVTVMSGPYAGEVLAMENFTTDGTLVYIHQSLGDLAGDEELYDLEIFTYFETSLQPVEGVVVNMFFYNGTPIETRTTEANGTLLFIDLPVAFINYTVSYLGRPVGAGEYAYNLTSQGYDIRKPVIVSPGDQEFLYGTENITIPWQLSDEYPYKIRVFRDNVLVEDESWTETEYQYLLNVSDYDIGVYSIRLVAEDQNHQTSDDTITLRIYENVTPVLSHPDDVTFYFTETGYSIQWNVTEDNPDMYVIEQDGEDVKSGTIDPENPFVTFSLNGLAIGVYTFTITVNDTSGNTATDSVTVTVKVDDVPPVIVFTPNNLTYSVGDLGLRFNWTAKDDFKDTYKITVDSIVAEEGDWTEENIWFDFGGLAEGDHVVTLTVFDLGGNSASSSVLVHVNPPMVVTMGMVLGGAGLLIIVLLAVYIKVKTR